MNLTGKQSRMVIAAHEELAEHPDEHGFGRWRAAEQAKRHLASLSPERRAELARDWNGDE